MYRGALGQPRRRGLQPVGNAEMGSLFSVEERRDNPAVRDFSRRIEKRGADAEAAMEEAGLNKTLTIQTQMIREQKQKQNPKQKGKNKNEDELFDHLHKLEEFQKTQHLRRRSTRSFFFVNNFLLKR